MERQLDDIADGNIDWITVIDNFYKEFNNTVENAKLINFNIISRELGFYPNTNNLIIATLGKHTQMIKMKKGDSKVYVNAPIQLPLTIDNITLEEAIEILKYPKELGKYERKKVILKRGQYGFYLHWGKDNISLKEELFDLDVAIKIIEEKKKINSNNNIKTFRNENNTFEYKILNGEYGFYIHITNLSRKYSFTVTIPDDIDINQLNSGTIQNIIDNNKKSNHNKNYNKKSNYNKCNKNKYNKYNKK
jgi:DNA topoisomerase-1